MATREDVLKWNEQYGDPASGGIVIRDKDGNEIGRTPYSESANEALRNNRTFYKVSDKEWSTTPTASVTLDEKTGNIKVKAPNYVLENEAFKQGLSENGVLRQLSAAYKQNKDFKMPDPLDETKDITVKEMVDRWNEYAQNYVKQTEDVLNFKDTITYQTGNRNLANALTEKDFILMRSTGTREEDNDKSLIAVPKTLQGNFYKNLYAASGYNTANGVISKGDLRSGVYNVGKSSADDIINALTEASAKLVEIENKKDITAEDAEEYARLTAFITYLQKEEPEAGFWEKRGMDLQAIGGGLMGAAHNIGGNLLVIGEGAANILNLITSPWLWGKPSSEWASTTLKDDLARSKMEDAQLEARLQQINSGAAILMALTETAGTVAGTLAVGKITSDAIAKLASAAATTASLSSTIKALSTGEIAAASGNSLLGAGALYKGQQFTASTIQSAWLTQTLGGVPTASRLLNTAQNILNLSKLNPAQLSNGVSNLINVLGNAARTQEAVNIVNNAVRTINTINKVAGASTVVSQIIVDTMITDGQLLREIVENQDPESAGELMKSVAFDGFMYAAGFGIGAIAQKFPQSKAGRAFNTRVAQAEAKVSTAVANAKENIKAMVLRDADYVSKIKNAPKRQAAEAAALIRKATANVAKAGAGLKGADKTLAINNSLQNLIAVQNAEDIRAAGIQTQWERMTNPTISPSLAPAYTNAMAVEQEIEKLEKQYGLNKKANYPVSRKGDNIGITTTLSNNYVNKFYRVGQIEDYYLETKTYKDGMEKELEANKAYVADFKEKYPKLADYLENTALPAYIKLNNGMVDFKRKNQILDEDALRGQQASPLFKRGYMHVQRHQELENQYSGAEIDIRVLQRKNATFGSDDSYAWGSTDDYLSPMTAFLNQAFENCNILNSRDEFNNYTKPAGIKRKILFTGEEVKRTKEITKLKDTFHKNTIQQFKGAKEGVVKYDLGNKLGDLMVSTSEYLNKRAETLKAGRAVARSKVKEPKITGVDRKAVFDGLPNDQITQYAVEQMGVTFTDIPEDTFNQYVNPIAGVKTEPAAAALRKEIRTSIATSADYIAGAYGFGFDVDQAQATLKSLPKIKTSSYKKLVGIKTLKDADPTIKPYLSESGVDLESGDWGQYMPEYQGEFEDGGSFAGTPDDVLDFYTRVVSEAQQEKELYLPTYDNYVQAINFDAELPSRLDRILLDKYNFTSSDIITDLATGQKRQSIIDETEMVYQQDIDELSKIIGLGKTQRRELLGGIDDMLSEFIYQDVMGDPASSAVVNDLAVYSTNKDAAVEYIVLSELSSAKEEFGGSITRAIESKVRQEINSYNAGKPTDEQIDAKRAVEKFEEVFDDALTSRMDKAMNQLREENSPLIDEKGIYEKTRQLMKDITKADSATNVFIGTNLEGLTEYYETDPMVADLVNHTPTAEARSSLEKFLDNKFFRAANRTMRLSTVALNPRSWVNQTFKDSISGFIGGAVRPAFMTEQMIAQEFGDNILEQFETTNRGLAEQIRTQATESGRTVGEQAARYAGAELEAQIGTSTETMQYRRETTNKAFAVTKKAGEKILEIGENINDFREVEVRKAVAMQTLYDALKNGYTYEESMARASRTMRDATTNFLRQTYHLQALTNTTPFLRAGISGSKSFWRLMSIDPVGVMTRLACGVILPAIAATVAIMTDDESREYYKTLYEREKRTSLIYKVNGKFMSIPLPEEVASMVAPWRHLVETMWNGNRHSFWELAINDLVGMFPYDLTGFQDIDNLALSGDPTLLDRIGSMGMGLLADILPPVGKTAFELTYGVDPYTGNKIDKSDVYVDENGNIQVYDSTQSEFAKWIGGLTGWSPSVVSSVTSNFIGTTGRNVLDWIVSTAQWVGTGGKEGDPLKLIKSTYDEMIKPLSVTEYDRTKAAWNSEINALFDEKETYMDLYEKYSQKILDADSIEKRQQYIAQRNDYIAPYIEKVKNTVTNIQKLGGSFDSYRFAMVVSLLNFETTKSGGTNSASRQLNKELGYDGKEEARLTIERMNVANSPNTDSLLGYMYKDKNGEIQVAYYTPLEIQNAQSIFYTSKDIHFANIKTLISESGLDKQYYNASQAVYENTTTADKDKARVEWNNKVFKVLFPYFQKYGVQSVMSNQDIVSYLEKYIMVPTSYKKNGRKSVYSEKLDSNLGFVKQYTIDAITEILK